MKNFFSLIFFSFLTSFTFSQNAYDPNSIIDIPDSVKTTYGFPMHSNSNTSKAFLLTEQLILTRPEKIMDELSFLPGTYSVPDGIGGQMLNIRGFDQNRITIFFNGIPVRSSTEGRISMDGLFFNNADVSIEKGNASLIYGANSSGNIIRIDNHILTEGQPALKINTYWGNNGKQNYNALITGNVHKKIYYQVSANYYKRNAVRLSKAFDTINSQADRTRLNSDQENSEFTGTLTFAPNKKHHISITGMYNASKFGYPPSLISPRYRHMDFWRNSSIGLRHSSAFSDKLILETNFYYTHLKDTMNEYTDITLSKIKKFSYWNDESLGAKGILSYKISSRHTLNYSIDFKKDIHEQVWYTTGTAKAVTLLSALEYNGEFIRRIFIQAGTSYNLNNPTYSSSNDDKSRKNLSAWNYQFSAAYMPLTKKYKVHAGYSNFTIFPRMKELYGDVLMGYTVNPDLTYEKGHNIDIGIESSFFRHQLSVQFNGYASIINDMITSIKPTDTTYQLVNLQSAGLSGFELIGKYTPNKKVFGLLSYSYLEAKNTSDFRTSGFIAYRPAHQLKAFVSYMPLTYFGFDVSYTYISTRKYDNQGIWYNLPSYSLVDFGISSKPIKYLTLWVKLNNILDMNYVGAYDQPQAGREFRFGLNLDINP